MSHPHTHTHLQLLGDLEVLVRYIQAHPIKALVVNCSHTVECVNIPVLLLVLALWYSSLCLHYSLHTRNAVQWLYSLSACVF